MKKTNIFYQIFLGSLLKLYTLFKGQKIIHKTKIKGPAIVLSNHTSFYDFMYTFSAIYPRRATFIAARKMFHEKGLKTFMKISRSIPKSLMETDLSSVKSTMQILRKRGIVAIFPEGQITHNGSTMQFNSAIAKLIKKVKVDVYIVKHYGAGLANPPWTKKTFKGPVLTKEFNLFNHEELNDLTVEQIHKKIANGLQYKPHEFVKEFNYKYKVNDITNLNNLFYLCQSCFHEGLTIKNNKLFCENCHAEFEYTNQGFINDITYEDFYNNQRNFVRKEIDNNPNYSLASSCTLMSIKDDKMQIVGEGTITLNKEIYTYEGTISGEPVIKTFNTKSVSFLPSDIGRNIQIYDGKQVYQFELDNTYLPTKFVIAGEFLYLKNNNLI